MNKLILATALVWSLASVHVYSQTEQSKKDFSISADVIRLELLPRKLELNESSEALLAPHTTKSKIYFRLQAVNVSTRDLTLFIIDPYYQNRPELLREGEIVSFKDGVTDRLLAREKDPVTRLVENVTLNPGASRVIEYLYLDDWYGALQPGNYRLSLKHRFEPGQDWIESSAIAFEVIKVESNRSASKP